MRESCTEKKRRAKSDRITDKGFVNQHAGRKQKEKIPAAKDAERKRKTEELSREAKGRRCAREK